MLLGRDLTVRRFSPQAEKQFELLAADVGRPIRHIRHALVLTDDADSLLDLETLSAEVIADVREQEREVRDKSGRWHSLRVRPYLTLDNKVDGAVLVLLDIDVLKRSEQAAAVAQEFAEDTLETVREPLLVLDHQLHVERANRAFYSHFRSAPAETVGKSIYEVNNHQWDIPSLRELLDKIPAQRTTIEDFFVEHDFDHLGRRTMLLNARLIEDPQHKTEGILLAIEDITDRERAEEAFHASEERFRAFSGQLEQMVTERTQELVQSHERLRALGPELNLTEQRQRKRLASEMHDSLAQWLVICCLNLGRMQQQIDLSPKASQIVKETEQMLDKSLEYTRALMTELSPPVLQEHGFPAALTWLGEQMQRHGLTVKVDVANMAYLMIHDDCAVPLFQSVRELLMNALKHAESKEVAVRLFEIDGDLCIEVRDEGAGFDLAASVASTPSMSSKFGLLSIRERMMALGGRFDLKSSPGAGTTATLVLPIGVVSAASAGFKVLSSGLSRRATDHPPTAVSHRFDHSQLTTQNAQLHQQDTKHIRVLLVDDHAIVLQGLRAVLESYPDVDVVGEAWNGEEAVACVERLQPTIVVMDIHMPKMNGNKATAQITSRFPGIIVIGLSVQAGGENEVAMRNAGASMLLTKEAAVEELYRAIRESLDLRLKGNVLSAESSVLSVEE